MLIILQAFPEYKTIDVGLAALPIIFIVAVTAIKDGLEDYRRWRQDKIVNERKTLILGSNGWRNYNYSDQRKRSISQRILYQLQK
jgi:phospholipid-translocating ATPase